MTTEQAVTNGINLLDQLIGDWRERIDPETLDMELVNSCILGQVGAPLGASFYAMASELRERSGYKGTSTDFAYEHGFEGWSGVAEEYEALREEWIRQLATTR